MVKKPPGCAELHLPANAPVLKAAGDRRAQLVVASLGVVEIRSSEPVVAIEPIEEAHERPSLLEVADGIEAAKVARAQLSTRTVDPQRTEMELLDPAGRVIHEREV